MKKKITNKKLQLNKETIAKMNQNELTDVKGGFMIWTTGCTDGCTGPKSLQSFFNCTNGVCSRDCNACA
jgi:natural product precursor